MKPHLERLPRTLDLKRDEDGLFLTYIDQRLLPGELRICSTRNWSEVYDAIKELAIRGAPAIGLAGAAALALWVDNASNMTAFYEASQCIAAARPTAVNLRWAVERAFQAVADAEAPLPSEGITPSEASDILFDLVQQMQIEDEANNRAIGAHGAELLHEGSCVLTHCNAGSLACCYYGTALGVIYAAAEQGKIERVYADETRPVGQGARLTVWELAQVGIPTTLICDNMAASLMASGCVDAVVVGADRIARNGDTANKIGTYGVAVLAKEHGIPFYVAAPMSTIDGLLNTGRGITIEQRAASEVLSTPIDGVDVWNPAFDITPARLITKIITEKGAVSPDELETLLP